MAGKLDRALADKRAELRSTDVSEWADKERLLLSSCHPKQLGFVDDPGRRIVALVARGGGKTTGGRARLVRRMMRTPKAKCLFVATTRQQAEELMWIPLKELLDKLQIEATFNETKLRCTLTRNGAQLRLVGADDKKEIEKLRGLPHHEVGIDEGASFDPTLLDHLVNRIIAPRLGDYGGCLWLIGTPGHQLRGPFYDATRTGSEISRPYDLRESPEFADWQRWSFHRWTLQDGAKTIPAMARLWAEALLNKEANGWSDNNPVWKREYLGQWAADDTESVYRYRAFTDDGALWNQWDPPRDPRTGIAALPAEYSDWRYVYGIDCGHGDPMGLVIFAWSPQERILRQVYGFERRGMYAKTIAELLIGEDLNHDRLGGLFGVTGWPDAIVADTAGLGDALLDELQNVYGVRIVAAEKKSKFDNIELFNGDLIDGRIKILAGSALETQLIELQWAEDMYGKIKEDKAQANHSTDAAIYARRAAYHQFAEEAPKPKPVRIEAAKQFQFDEADLPAGEFDSILADDTYFQDGWGN